MTKCTPNLKTLEEKWDNTPSYLTKGKLWQLFDNIYDCNREAFAAHIIKITCWEQWAIDICNERLENGKKIGEVIDLNNKSRKAVLAASNDNYANDNYQMDDRKKSVL